MSIRYAIRYQTNTGRGGVREQYSTFLAKDDDAARTIAAYEAAQRKLADDTYDVFKLELVSAA